MVAIFRKYEPGDYQQCEDLVEKTWSLNSIFETPSLSGIATLAYTRGSLEMSNYRMVVEVGNKVEGFIFALNENKKTLRKSIFFRLTILWKLFWLKGDKTERNALLDALKVHVKNRSNIVERGSSEILLFVVSQERQGKGFGKALWSGFRDCCVESEVKSIFVSTNKDGASSFYQNIGFKHVGDFRSPLHELARWGGQPCMYGYQC